MRSNSLKNILFILFWFLFQLGQSQCQMEKAVIAKNLDGFSRKGAEPIEGVWKVTFAINIIKNNQVIEREDYSNEPYEVAIINDWDQFVVCRIVEKQSDNLTGTGHEMKFYRTSNKNNFLFKSSYSDKLYYDSAIVRLRNNSIIKFSYVENPEITAMVLGNKFEKGITCRIDYEMIKIIPDAGYELDRRLKSSGSGFLISTNGFIITNFHVIDGFSKIRARGLNNDFSYAYNVEVVSTDKEIDLAVLKINDDKFKKMETIPFSLQSSESNVGADVYVLGYPLRNTMGDEIKLTTGVISSKSGFLGNEDYYQISAPTQAGNSGGPLLSKNGNVIGVINAKHKAAENVSYAIKSEKVINILKKNNLLFPKKSLLMAKSLEEQVKIMKKFVCVLEIY